MAAFQPVGPGARTGFVVQGQTFTPGGGGTFGRSVPAVPSSGLTSSVPRSIVEVKQDSSFRANLMIARAGENEIEVDVLLYGPAGGAPVATRVVTIGLSASRSAMSRTASASTAWRERARTLLPR